MNILAEKQIRHPILNRDKRQMSNGVLKISEFAIVDIERK